MSLADETPTEEFARLLDEAESHRLRALPFDQLRRLARLYRGETSRLARLRDRGSDLDQIALLNALCVRAHGFLYSRKARTASRRSLFELGIAALARSGPLLSLAWAVLGVGAFVGFCLVRLDPTALYALMPAGLGYDPAQIDALYASASARDQFFAREETSTAANAMFGSSLFAHNTRVGILAFATGVLGGIPTLLLQFYNGIMVGTISAIFIHGGPTLNVIPGDHALLYVAWILPHGVPELTAITLCTGAGFALGRAVAAPGRRPRSEALRRAAPMALALVGASVPLFLAAAAIESFVRESALGTAPRLAVAAAGALILIVISLAIRRSAREETEVERAEWLEGLVDPNAPQPAP